jgi:hypothetical protein
MNRWLTAPSYSVVGRNGRSPAVALIRFSCEPGPYTSLAQMDHGHGAARRSYSFLSRTALSSCAASATSCGPRGHNEHRQLRAWRVGRKSLPPPTLLYGLLLREVVGDRRALASTSDGVRAQRATLRGRAGEPPERAGVPSTLCGRASTLAGRLAAAAAPTGQVEGSASGEHDHIFGFFTSLVSSGNFSSFFLLPYDLHQQ